MADSNLSIKVLAALTLIALFFFGYGLGKDLAERHNYRDGLPKDQIPHTQDKNHEI
ncbi:MAG: hypothetical protein Q4G49_02825 [Paracoccus sp. (in: a-proteobacteria)]|nr:hypothetical protein [Paracoccus sp. (in: a-proteobacteria)]